MSNAKKQQGFIASTKPLDFFIAVEHLNEFLAKLTPEQDFLRTPKYSSSTLNISRRTLSHWRKVGLLDESETTKLSYIECFWVTIVNELRQFGMSLEKVKRVKECIFNLDRAPVLLFYLFCFFRKDIDEDYFLIVNSEGDADIGSTDDIEVMETLNLLSQKLHKD
jgi:hypothetical protein